MATLEAIQPYVEQFFDDSDVHKQLSRAASNLRAARTRATKAKSKRGLLQDERLRRRVLEAVTAAYAAGSAIADAPHKSRRRGRAVLVLGLMAAGGAVAANADARGWVQSLLSPALDTPEREA